MVALASTRAAEKLVCFPGLATPTTATIHLVRSDLIRLACNETVTEASVAPERRTGAHEGEHIFLLSKVSPSSRLSVSVSRARTIAFYNFHGAPS